MQSILNKMKLDGCSEQLIAEFSGVKYTPPAVDLKDPKFNKYHKMKKIGMPLQSVLNKMRMDGMKQLDIDVFSGKIIPKDDDECGGRKSREETLANLATEMNLKPRKVVFPTRVKKLKRLHWKIIDLKLIKGTFWERLCRKFSDSDVNLGAKFEVNFQIRQKKPRNPSRKHTSVKSLMDGSSKKGKHQRIAWISPKRDQNIQIGLKKVGLSHEQIYEAFAKMDESVMTLERLETILDLVPTPQEQLFAEEKIDKVGDDIQYCGVSEMFFVELSTLPEIRQQILKWMFVRTFPEYHAMLLQQVTLITRAAQSIKHSKAFKAYLQTILAMGNLMNHGTKNNCAYGFNIECFKILDGIKDFGGKKTLTMFLYEHAYNKLPESRRLTQELQCLKQAVRMETLSIEINIKEMKDEFSNIDIFCNRLSDDYHEEDSAVFRSYMRQWLKDNISSMDKLHVRLKNAKTISNSVAKFFGFDLDEGRPESLFILVQNFVDSVEKARRSLLKFEKERLKEQQKRKREVKKNIGKKKIGLKNRVFGKINKGLTELNENITLKPMTKVISIESLLVSKMSVDESKVDGNDSGSDYQSDDEFFGENEEISPMFSDFAKKVESFRSRQYNMEQRLSTNFNEKKALAKGQFTLSLKQNLIKQKSVTSLLSVDMAKAMLENHAGYSGKDHLNT